MILWTLKWTKHHWFSKCGLVYCTSDLNLVMLEKYAFMSKNSIYAKFYSCSMILMASSHIYFLIFIICPCTTHTHIYILLALCQNPSFCRRFDSTSPQDLQTLSGSLSSNVFSRFSFDFFDLLLIFVNVRSPYLGAPLGYHNLVLNLI
jgi:hypothetical protein